MRCERCIALEAERDEALAAMARITGREVCPGCFFGPAGHVHATDDDSVPEWRDRAEAAESSLSRAVEALRGAEAHHDEQARLWADNESDGEADLNAQYHSERRDVFTAVLAEVGK